MIGWLAFYAGLTAATWTVLWPMFRAPAMLVPPELFGDVPNATFDHWGLV